MLASRMAALFNHLGDVEGQERWENGEPESWEWCCEMSEFFQTSVLTVVTLLVDCSSEGVLVLDGACMD